MADANHADIAQMNFETALRELEAIVDKLEGGKIDLEGIDP